MLKVGDRVVYYNISNIDKFNNAIGTIIGYNTSLRVFQVRFDEENIGTYYTSIKYLKLFNKEIKFIEDCDYKDLFV